MRDYPQILCHESLTKRSGFPLKRLSESVIKKTSKEIPVATLPRGLINVSRAARICHPDGVRSFFLASSTAEGASSGARGVRFKTITRSRGKKKRGANLEGWFN